MILAFSKTLSAAGPKNSPLTRWIIAAFIFLALLSGLIATTGANKVTFGMIGVVGALFIAAIPPARMVPILAIICFLVIGQLEYFLRIKQGLWIPYALAVFLYFRLPGAYLQSPQYQYRQINTPFILLVLSFMVCVAISIILNAPSPLQAIAGGKNYTIMWAIYLATAYFAIKIDDVEKVLRWLIPLAFLQLPFILYQYLVVAANRSTRGGRFGVAWDAIVGSFGGDPMAGGASGSMAYFLVAAVVYAFALCRKKQAPWWIFYAVFGIAGLSVGLAEVKVVVLLLPLGFGVLLLPDMAKRPLFTVGAFVCSLFLMVGLLMLYDHLHYAGTGLESKDLGDLYIKTFGYSTDGGMINFETGEMGRTAALSFWTTESWGRDALHGLLGFSPGASRSDSILAIGELAKKYPFRLDRSTAAQMLWEIGALGSALFVLTILTGAYRAFKASLRYHDLPLRQATLQATSAMLLMNIVMWPYGRELLEVPAQTFTLMLCLGYVAQVDILQKLDQIKRTRGH